MTEPRGPVYLFGAREVMEESIEPLHNTINVQHWLPPAPAAMVPSDVSQLFDALSGAKKPLIVTSWLGNNDQAVKELIVLSETLAIPVLDHAPFALNFPPSHPHYQGTHWSGGGQHPLLAEADVVLVIDSDVPWIPIDNRPAKHAVVYHMDIDPLKQVMPLFYIPASYRYAVSSAVALAQLNVYGSQQQAKLGPTVQETIQKRRAKLAADGDARKSAVQRAAQHTDSDGPQAVAVAMKALKAVLPEKTMVVSEAISK